MSFYKAVLLIEAAELTALQNVDNSLSPSPLPSLSPSFILSHLPPLSLVLHYFDFSAFII